MKANIAPVRIIRFTTHLRSKRPVLAQRALMLDSRLRDTIHGFALST